MRDGGQSLLPKEATEFGLSSFDKRRRVGNEDLWKADGMIRGHKEPRDTGAAGSVRYETMVIWEADRESDN